MGFFSKLFKGPEIDMEKSDANAKKMRALFHQAVGGGEDYRLIFGYTEDVSRFNYGFVHGSKTKIGNLLVGWNEESQTIVVVPTVPDLSGCGEPVYYRRSEILKAYRNKYPTDAFIIVKAEPFCPEIAGLFCHIAGLFCHSSRTNLSLKPACFDIAIS